MDTTFCTYNIDDNCPSGATVIECDGNPCDTATCSAKDATCVPNYCGGCNAVFYDYTGQNEAKCLRMCFNIVGNQET